MAGTMRDDPTAPAPAGGERNPTSPASAAAAGAAIVGLAIALLLTMGRQPWCRCGSAAVWVADAWGPHNSQHLTDPYTFTHLEHGALFFLALRAAAGRLSLRARALLAVAAESAWEIVENSPVVIERYRAATMALGYFGDSALNSAGDILACGLGFALAARLAPRTTVLLMLLTELALGVWIRDGLLLNVAMLAYPIEAIKIWQLGH